MSWILAMFAGGAGALARFGLAGWLQARLATERPWGTAVVNLTGAAVLGFLAGWGALSAAESRVFAAGFLGGYTTFSTWMVESELLAEGGGGRALAAGAVNVVGLLAVGVLAAAAGFGFGTAI